MISSSTLTSYLKLRSHSPLDLREFWWVAGRFDCPSVDWNDWDNNTCQEKRGQLVDIFDSYKNHHCHQSEADGAVDSHIVQHRTVTPKGVSGVKDGCLRDQIFLRRKKDNTRFNGSILQNASHRLYLLLRDYRVMFFNKLTKKISMAPSMYMAEAKVVPK